MWPHFVVVLPPNTDDGSCIVKIFEPVLVQTAVTESCIEAFDKRVLCRFTWLDEVKLHTMSLAPEEHRFARHLWAVIEHDGFG